MTLKDSERQAAMAFYEKTGCSLGFQKSFYQRSRVQMGMAIVFFILALAHIGVALGFLDIWVLAYAPCRNCPRNQVPNVWMVKLLCLLFSALSLVLWLEAKEIYSRWVGILGSAAWFSFVAVLARYSVYSDGPVIARILLGFFASIFVLAYFLFGTRSRSASADQAEFRK